DVQLVVIQSPNIAKLAIGKEKDRKPMDPPPIVQLKLSEAIDHQSHFLNSSHYFMTVALIEGLGGIQPPIILGSALSGTHVSSLHRLKDTNNQDGAFFIFGDLSIKVEGTWALQFNLYEMDQERNSCTYITACRSSPFKVQTQKGWIGMQESTQLTRTFAEQGVRLRLRKEPRTLLRQGGPS
ncbi:velvet factor, partial [Calycina marina]